MKRKIILLLIVLFWMGVIFYFSSRNSEESTNQSQGIINKTNIVEMYDNKTETEDREEILTNIDRHFRKVAHAIIFMILAVFVCMFFNEYNFDIKKVILFSFLICCLYAISDEIHQYFVPGRSAEVRDIIIDNLGSCLGYFIFYMVKGRKK